MSRLFGKYTQVLQQRIRKQVINPKGAEFKRMSASLLFLACSGHRDTRNCGDRIKHNLCFQPCERKYIWIVRKARLLWVTGAPVHPRSPLGKAQLSRVQSRSCEQSWAVWLQVLASGEAGIVWGAAWTAHEQSCFGPGIHGQ